MILPIPAESLKTVISSFLRSHSNRFVCINQIFTSVFQVRVQAATSIMISLMDTPARACPAGFKFQIFHSCTEVYTLLIFFLNEKGDVLFYNHIMN